MRELCPRCRKKMPKYDGPHTCKVRKPLPKATRPIARHALPDRSGRPPRVNPARQAREWPRKYGSKARVRFVAAQPCYACGYAGPYPRQNAHTPDPDAGTGRKGSYRSIIPLCGPCHVKQDDVNGGWLAIGMTRESCRRAAAQTEDAWQEHLAARQGAPDEP